MTTRWPAKSNLKVEYYQRPRSAASGANTVQGRFTAHRVEIFAALNVTVNGGTSATVDGVTVTLNPTTPNASGQVFADVAAACTATNATLRFA